MPFRVHLREHGYIGVMLLKWLIISIPLGGLVGSACALFLWSLDRATSTRLQHPHLLYLLPVAGVVISLLYARWGTSVEAGNNLIVDEIHEPGGGIPLRMAPLILVSTVITHLFGGSAGREGTAVQMGGSIASGLAQRIPNLTQEDIRILLMAGVAAGFGGIFGTPVAGAIFALEVVVIGRMTYAAILPCLIASIVSDQTCVAWGIEHTAYHVASQFPAGTPHHLAPFAIPLFSKVIVAAILFGLTSFVFAELVHGLQHLFRHYLTLPLLRPFVGGMLVIAITWIVGTSDYLGLGVTASDPNAVTISSCFHAAGSHPGSWFWKILFTAVTLSSGFKGGEVTPLFFIGAALGNTLAVFLGAPIDLFAALGFVSVFAGATNTPIACTVMAMELFGAEYAVYYAASCVIAYMFSGHSGIYLSQKIGTPKFDHPDAPTEQSLRRVRESRSFHHLTLTADTDTNDTSTP